MDNQFLMLGLAAVALLVAARLLAGGVTVRGLIQSLVTWAAFGVIAFIAFNHQQEIAAILARVSDRFGYEQQKVEGDTIRIPMSRDGHFWAKVSINGVERRMLVDSGATVTALSEATAREAGIGPGGLPVVIETANGSIQARSTQADLVEVGPLKTRDLEIVVASSFGEFDVLGMNFLSRLKSWRVEGKTLVLEPARKSDRKGSEKRDSSAKRGSRES